MSGLADVAAGLNGAYVELHINSWDALAGILLVREAGGYVNDFLADDGLNKGNLLFASTPELVDRIMPMLHEVTKP
jgi:myo-inositol-1(or 4)-monophosphatase